MRGGRARAIDRSPAGQSKRVIKWRVQRRTIVGRIDCDVASAVESLLAFAVGIICAAGIDGADEIRISGSGSDRVIRIRSHIAKGGVRRAVTEGSVARGSGSSTPGQINL